MKTNTRQLIDRALVLADFNDSYFIGDAELTHLLNDLYYELYNELIKREDKTFLRKIEISDRDKLPSDFFKLNKVSKNERLLFKSQDYDIIGNRFKLEKFETVDFYYYPNPPSLTLKSKSNSRAKYDEAMLYWEDGYVTQDGIVRSEDGDLFSITSFNTILSNGYLNENKVYTFDSEEIAGPVCIRGNEITYDSIKTRREDILAVIIPETEKWGYYLTVEGKLLNKDFELVSESFYPTTLYCKNDGLYFTQNNKLYRYLGKELEEMKVTGKVLGILNGSLISVQLGDSYKEKGYGTDSELEMPSIFFSYMAYSLANSIAAYVGRDTEVLQERYKEIKQDFYESLQSDINSVYTLRDEGGYGGYCL